MCAFISGEGLMPGFICCKCRGYNGLQRLQCKDCHAVPHKIEIPPEVNRRGACGYGWIGKADWKKRGDGVDVRGRCPCCLTKLDSILKH